MPNEIQMEFLSLPRHGLKAKIPPLAKKCPASVISKYETSFAVVAPKLWNLLPKDVNEIEELIPFKCALKKFLSRISDMPPTKGYTTVNSNFLYNWNLHQSGSLQNVR